MFDAKNSIFACAKWEKLTFRSFKQLELSVMSSVRRAQPIRAMAGLGVSVMGNAGLGWSGLSGRRVGDVGAGEMAAP